MGNRRKIKLTIKNETDILIEDAIIRSLVSDEKQVKKLDELIDEVIDFRYELLSQVNGYPRNGERAAIKKHFSEIKSTLTDKVADYFSKIAKA